MQHRTLWPTLLLLLAPFFSASPACAQQPALRIEVLNVEPNKGKVVLALYKDKASWLKTPYRKLTLPTDKSTQTVVLAVPPGAYAISIFQDTNGNGELDQNFVGIPKEPIGFGNNYHPFGKPKFESAVINYAPASKLAAIKLFTIL
ncbi:DUF2141 domain-containing protein [Hymenobacter bucti]|uniref:DUF2141 domain-containing protein n=1 Tax=Hymenobacter bucti TaxID=1844114 RepID=A0ABW4QV12_9BACT